MSEQLRVGGEIESWCTSCKQMKWHTIVAMVGVKPAKVECHGCHKQHQFRAGPAKARGEGDGEPAAVRVRGAGRSSGSRASSAGPAAPAFDLAAQINGREHEARVYTPDVSFAVGDLVQHPLFGVGLVVATAAPQKMDVEFRDGRKVLVQGRNAAAQAGARLMRPPAGDEHNVRFPDTPRGIK